jgi:hypothetical protein
MGFGGNTNILRFFWPSHLPYYNFAINVVCAITTLEVDCNEEEDDDDNNNNNNNNNNNRTFLNTVMIRVP